MFSVDKIGDGRYIYNVPADFWTKGVDNSKTVLETILEKIKFYDKQELELLCAEELLEAGKMTVLSKLFSPMVNLLQCMMKKDCAKTKIQCWSFPAKNQRLCTAWVFKK